MAEGTGTSAPEDQAPAVDDKTLPATGSSPDEVTVLKSRNAGLDAKVTELTKLNAAAEARAAEAAQRLADYEAGKVGNDEALRAQLAAEQQKTAEAEKKAALALVKATYPESFAELGDAAALMSEEKLASLEARLNGSVDSGDAPTPRGNNPPRTGQRGAPAKPTIEQVEADLRRMLPNGGWGQ